MDITQNVTPKDIEKGQIRCGVAIKPFLPDTRSDVEFSLMGSPIRSSYDPRNGPDKDRSGVLRVGRERLASLLGEGPSTLRFRLTDAGPSFY